MELRALNIDEIVKCQQRGYFDEHLASLYSIAYGEPYLYEDKYLLYHDSAGRTISLTLFELDKQGDNNSKRLGCFRDVTLHFKPRKVVVTSPFKLPSRLEDYRCDRIYEDKDYQIALEQFDENLRGGEYKSLRYHVHHARRCGYSLLFGKSLTATHINIIAEFLTKSKNYEVWDYQLYLGLGDYISKFASPRFLNVFSADLLVGFDVVDFLGDVMAVPLGFYLDYPSVADYFVYEEILHAKQEGFRWLDIGWTCGTHGLEEFKVKWKAVPRFRIYMQTFVKA